MIVSIYSDALADVPTERLGELFKRAIKGHTGSFMLTHGDLLRTWRDWKEERLIYPERPNAGALPAGSPAPLFNLRPLIAEIKRWSEKLPSARPVEPPDPNAPPLQAELRRRANFGRYALNVKRYLGYDSIDECIAWVRGLATDWLADKPDITWEELLMVIHADQDQPPDPRIKPAWVCPTCRGMGRVKEYQMGWPVDVKCRECAA